MTRETLPALGYVYVALALPALIVGPDDQRLQATLLTGAVFAYFWFIASLGAKVMRFAPDGFFASVVVAAGAAYVPLEAASAAGGTSR